MRGIVERKQAILSHQLLDLLEGYIAHLQNHHLRQESPRADRLLRDLPTGTKRGSLNSRRTLGNSAQSADHSLRCGCRKERILLLSTGNGTSVVSDRSGRRPQAGISENSRNVSRSSREPTTTMADR